ncbi:MAG: hypothetical protein OEX82_05565 [Nitrosomonas sp.]|nr:hypothetical protein [Nitrosomonas sp.]
MFVTSVDDLREADMEKNGSYRGFLRNEILNYLCKNPNAGDSLKGVMSCWISSTHKNTYEAEIEEILEQLIAEGRVKKISLIDGTCLYKQGNHPIYTNTSKVGQ